MGGPGAEILLRDSLTKPQENELESWLRSITSIFRKEEQRNGYEFWFNSNAFPGTVSKCAFHLSVDEAGEYWDEDQIQEVKEQLGYVPEQSIYVSTFCNGKAEHTTLGPMVLHLAEKYDGLIDMQGAITPPSKPVNREQLDEWYASEQHKKGMSYLKARYDALEESLPPGKTMRDLLKEEYLDPNSPLKAIRADTEAQFGPLFPPGLEPHKYLSLEEISTYVKAMPGKVYEFEYTTAAGHPWVSHIVDTTFLRAWIENPNFHMIK